MKDKVVVLLKEIVDENLEKFPNIGSESLYHDLYDYLNNEGVMSSIMNFLLASISNYENTIKEDNNNTNYFISIDDLKHLINQTEKEEDEFYYILNKILKDDQLNDSINNIINHKIEVLSDVYNNKGKEDSINIEENNILDEKKQILPFKEKGYSPVDLNKYIGRCLEENNNDNPVNKEDIASYIEDMNKIISRINLVNKELENAINKKE